jgi:hypothetical protein
MKITNLRVVGLLLIAPLIVVSGGCVAAKTAASSTVSWIRGALEIHLDSPIEEVGRAATKAVLDLKFNTVLSKVDVVSGEFTAETAQGTDIGILLNRVTDNTTKVSIRVGPFGDEALSQMLLDEIRKNL